MNINSDVIIVGAGAAGLVAAISAARMGSRVLVLEHMDQAGKKILSTGNGKCNFTNQAQGMEFYRGNDPAFVLPVFSQFGLKQTLDFFEGIGVWYKEKRGGYYYPLSGQASAVRQALLQEARRLSIRICYNIGIRGIRMEASYPPDARHKRKQERGIGDTFTGERFIFDTKQGIFESRVCIIATGGKAAKMTGSDGSGIPYIVGFSHKVTDFVPALVQLQGKQPFLKELAGIRADAGIRLYANGKKLAEDLGEIQLTDFGVSGIPAFQVSRHGTIALKEGKAVHVLLDFMPQFSEQDLYQKLACFFSGYDIPAGTEIRLKDILTGLLHSKLIPVVLREAGIPEDTKIVGLAPEANVKGSSVAGYMERLVSTLKHFRIDIIGHKSFDHAQVCAGGVSTDGICPDTMESRLVKNLYFAGEVVDIDGMCGGYNLQWAWSSGWVAGYHGGKRGK